MATSPDSIASPSGRSHPLAPSRRHASPQKLASPQRPSDAQTVRGRDDLLGIYSSRLTPTRTRSRGASTSGPKGWSSYVDSLGRDEIALLDTRFDDMTDEEIARALEPYAGREPASPPGSASSDGALFPPSPPPVVQREHPLRILSRAVRELREVIGRLEEENERLSEREVQVHQAEPVPVAKERSDQLSIHDSLADALSTTLAPALSTSTAPALSTSTAPALGLQLDGRRGPSPSPSLQHRATSPAPSHNSLRSVRSVPQPSLSVETGTRRASDTGKRPGWGSIWGWGKRPAPKGSVTSLVLPPEDEDDSWRRGDGGSTPSFRAIFLATRILTPDPGSILVGPANGALGEFAHALVSNARDEGIATRDPPGRQRARSRAASVNSKSEDAGGYGDGATAAVGQLLSRGKAAISGLQPPQPVRPALLKAASARQYPTTAMAATLPSPGHTPTDTPLDTPPPSVELSSIVPHESRPPTVLLSRQDLGSFFQSTRVAPKMTTATRFSSDQEPLTDRYGFICRMKFGELTADDIQHASMLKDASRVGTPAPISLTGHVPETPVRAVRAAVKEPKGKEERARRPKSARALPSSLHVPIADYTERRTSMSGRSSESPRSGRQTPESTTPPRVRRRTSALLAAPGPAPATAAEDQLTVSVRGSGVQASASASPCSPSSSAAALSESLPNEDSSASASSAAASRMTVSSLLGQLTDIHDRQQKARTGEWDAFLRKRTRSRRGTNGTRAEQDVGVGGALAQIINLSANKSGADEYRALLRLVRRGIPMSYRAEVWSECSGARDLIVPGEYAEILAVHKDDRSPVMAEIEKDVGRTFPGNVFFGGDGPGVAKLRRVLTAYAWHNPAVGYCQGMNMLAATLLLTYTDEEQAFWVLHCMVERLLPPDYYAPSLLGSRADQAVLADLVATHVPRVTAHLAKLGVDLTVITFGWFLSLFTDCLPVETLFRVWDVLFVEGHDVVFRVALAILKLNEAELVACEGVSELFAVVSGMTGRLWSADKLVALQHGFKAAVRREVGPLREVRTAELQLDQD